MLLQTAARAAGGQQYPPGALYVVGTPIGNLADLTLRAIHVLSLVDTVACEDTRTSQRLLQHLGLSKRLLAVHEHNENQGAEGVVALLRAGQRVAYVSDAGTPGVSDPGARLARAVSEAGLPVVPIPGASASVTLMSVAGDAHSQGFGFLGFLPPKGAERRQALARLNAQPCAVVLFESPHRMAALADELAALDAARRVTVGRELTKQFEEIRTLSAGELPAWVRHSADRQRGEFALVWHAPSPDEAARDDAAPLPAAALNLLGLLVPQGPLKEVTRLLAEATGLPRNRLYEQALQIRKQAGKGDADDENSVDTSAGS